jgi:hypothetical protein
VETLAMVELAAEPEISTEEEVDLADGEVHTHQQIPT